MCDNKSAEACSDDAVLMRRYSYAWKWGLRVWGYVLNVIRCGGGLPAGAADRRRACERGAVPERNRACVGAAGGVVFASRAVAAGWGA